MTGRQSLRIALLGLALSGCASRRLAAQGEAHLADGKATYAARCYRQACEKRPSRTDYQLGLARALLAAGQADQAEVPARKAWEAHEEGASPVLANVLTRMGRPDEAEPMLQEALRLTPSDPDTLELAALWSLVKGDRQEAATRMREAVAGDATPRRKAALAWVLGRAGELPEATPLAAEAVASGTHEVDALGDAAAVLFLAGQAEVSASAAREVQSYAADVLDRWREQAARSQSAGDKEGTLRAIARAVTIRPADGVLLGELGVAFLGTGDPDPAIRYLELALQSEAYRTAWDRARAWDEETAVATMGFQNDAAAKLSRALAEAWIAKANALQAARHLRASLLIGGGATADQWAEVASRFASANDLRNAVSAAREATRLQADHLGALMTLARCHRAVGDAAQAVGYARMAWQTAPGDPHVALLLGELYEKRGEAGAAREIYLEALRKNPQLLPLRTALKRVEQ